MGSGRRGLARVRRGSLPTSLRPGARATVLRDAPTGHLQILVRRRGPCAARKSPRRRSLNERRQRLAGGLSHVCLPLGLTSGRRVVANGCQGRTTLINAIVHVATGMLQSLPGVRLGRRHRMR